MAALLTLLAVAAGVLLGLAKGGRLDNALMWRPELWQVALGGVVVQIALRISGWSGGFAVFFDIASTLLVLAFCVRNIRVGGMVVIVVGICLNLAPTIINWGTPVRPQAIVSAGIVTQQQLDQGIAVDGPRHLADGDALAFLGETIPLPTNQVISIGDLILHAGYVLTIASVLRRRRVRGGPAPEYRKAISSLGRGPATPRRRPAPTSELGNERPVSRQPSPRSGGGSDRRAMTQASAVHD